MVLPEALPYSFTVVRDGLRMLITHAINTVTQATSDGS